MVDRNKNQTKPFNMNQKKFSSIRLGILVHIAWRNLVSKKLRTSLTILGVVIGVGAIYFLLSFGLGLQKLVTNEIIGDKSVKLVEVTTPNSKIVKLNPQTVTDISELAHVDEISKQHTFPGIISFNGAEIDSVTYGIDEVYQRLITLNLSYGRLLTAKDENSILINIAALESIGIDDPESAVGTKLDITVPLTSGEGQEKNNIENTFEIVGIIDSGNGSEVFLPIGLFEARGVQTYSTVRALADDSAEVPNLRQQIESLGLETNSPIDTLDQVNQIFKFFNIVLAGFGSIGMFVSVIGMFNTITVSLLERTKEIGLMVALGARKSDMRKLFIIEASLVSLAGAVVGVIVAVVCGFVLNAVMNQLASERGVSQGFTLFSHPAWLVLGTILFMIITGLVVAYLPSRRAEKIDPIDALRRE